MWIDINEKLPNSEYVLVWAPEYYERPLVAGFVKTKDGFEFWDDGEWDDTIITDYVTHWIPYDEPPKK